MRRRGRRRTENEEEEEEEEVEEYDEEEKRRRKRTWRWTRGGGLRGEEDSEEDEDEKKEKEEEEVQRVLVHYDQNTRPHRGVRGGRVGPGRRRTRQAGPGRYCSPRHSMPCNSGNDGSKCQNVVTGI